MIRLDPAEIATRPGPFSVAAEGFLDRLQAGNEAFAALARAIDGIDPPAAKELLTPAAEPPFIIPCVVLVVDDEPAVLTVTALRLRRAGYHVLEVSSGPDAILMLESRGDVCIVLSDCNMMPMRGADLAKLVLKRWPHIGYIAMSGEPPASDLPHDVSFIHKPHAAGAIVAAIERERRAVERRKVTRPESA